VTPRLLIQVLPLGPERAKKRREGIALAVSPFVRSANDPTVAIKLVSRAFLDRAKALAQEEGADDALLFGEEGQVLETTTANFFLIDSQGRLATTTLCDAFLPGITRARVLRSAQELGWSMGSNWLQKEDLQNAREAFVTNAVLGVVPIRRLGSKDLPLGSMTLELQRFLDD
jgi:4-amino-4-deoxychorismate lyase